MNKSRVSYIPYLWKTILWTIGNAIFGLFPLLFMISIYYMSDKKIEGDQIDKMIYDGAIIFVCIALVGSVLVDFLLSGRRLDGFARFSVYLFPCIILFFATGNYYLIHSNVIDKSRFGLTSNTTRLTVALSVLYIIFVKTNLYVQENVSHEHQH